MEQEIEINKPILDNNFKLLIEPVYEKHDTIGAYKPYKLIQDGEIHSNSVFYKSSEKLIREIHYPNFDLFCNGLYSLVKYQIHLQNYKGFDRGELGLGKYLN